MRAERAGGSGGLPKVGLVTLPRVILKQQTECVELHSEDERKANRYIDVDVFQPICDDGGDLKVLHRRSIFELYHGVYGDHLTRVDLCAQ